MEKINTTGQANKKRIVELDAEREKAQVRVVEIDQAVSGLTAEISKVKADIEAAQENGPKVSDLPEYQAQVEERARLEREISELSVGVESEVADLEERRKVIEAKIEADEKALAKIEQVQKAEDRIAELKGKEKTLAKKYQELSRHLHLIETFIRSKVSMLESRINDHFDLVSFKLFKEQINGGLAECCEVTVNGVPYSSLNNGGRVKSGLAIIKTLSRHYNFHPTIVIDNRESVTKIPEMETQVISLFVSEPDKSLRVVAQ